MAVECNRCCCCIPLRRGLLTWGYLRLIADVIVIISSIMLSITKVGMPKVQMVNMVLSAAFGLIDFPFTIVFIVGAHKKNYTLLKVYYYYVLVSTVVQTLTFVLITVLVVTNVIENHPNRSYTKTRPFETWSSYDDMLNEREVFLHSNRNNTIKVEVLVQEIVSIVFNLLIQVYLALLTRSEFLKLERNSKNQFVRNPAYTVTGIQPPFNQP